MKKWCSAGLLLLICMAVSAYEVLVFGDVHFDADAVRDPAATRPAYQEKERNRNLHNWQKNIPAMLDRAAKKAGPETAFLLQLGDLVQGDCGSQDLHEKSLRTVLAEFEKRFPNVRFFTAPGNHDMRGKGAATGYQAVMVPRLSAALSLPQEKSSTVQYAFMQEKDLYVVLDCNHPDPAFLEKSLAAHPQRRHLFVAVHIPVSPVASGNPGGVLLGRQSQAELRRKFIRLLAENNAVILCAHIHAATLVRWQSDAGSVTQVSFFSIFPDNPGAAGDSARDPGNWFPKFAEQKDDAKKQRSKAVLADFLAGYREIRDIRPSAGFSLLKVTDAGISLELYNTAAAVPTHVLKIKQGN